MENKQTSIQKTSGITLKDKVGYALGDVGSVLVLGLVNSILQKFYTDELGLAPSLLIWMFLFARIFDAAIDPFWATIVDNKKENKHGRYRQWLLKLALPLAICSVLMFLKIPNLGQIEYFLIATATYILFIIAYSGLNIPYGSMSMVITTDEKERSSLSMFRSVGSVMGGMPALVLSSMCYKDKLDEFGNVIKINGIAQKQFDYPLLITGVIIISLLSIVANLGCFKLSKERVKVEKKEKINLWQALKKIFKNKAVVSISIVSMLFLTAQMFSQSYSSYLMHYYFNAPELNMIITGCQYMPIALLLPFAHKITNKFGKKEVCAAGMILAVLGYSLLFFLPFFYPEGTHVNVWIYIAVTFLASLGTGFYFLHVWSTINDAIDYSGARYDEREDATTYAFFTFTRQLGQAISAVIVNLALVWMNYDSNTIYNSPESLEKMYNMSAIVPALLYLALFIVLVVFYPINKKKLIEIQAIKEIKLTEYLEK